MPPAGSVGGKREMAMSLLQTFEREAGDQINFTLGNLISRDPSMFRDFGT